MRRLPNHTRIGRDMRLLFDNSKSGFEPRVLLLGSNSRELLVVLDLFNRVFTT
jgi:hypothetical protein